jgi:hypothetical protein
MRRLRIQRSRFIARLPGIRLGKARNETRLPRPSGRGGRISFAQTQLAGETTCSNTAAGPDFTAPSTEELSARPLLLSCRIECGPIRSSGKISSVDMPNAATVNVALADDEQCCGDGGALRVLFRSCGDGATTTKKNKTTGADSS